MSPLIFLKALWPVFLIMFVAAIMKIVMEYLEKRRLTKLGITDIDELDGKTFEKYLEAFYERAGYNVERTKYIGDYGADLVLERSGIRKVIQAKRWKGKVGVKAIQEVAAAKGYYGCQEAMVVTNSYYTEQAKQLARSNNIELWDRKKLIAALSGLSSASELTSNDKKNSELRSLSIENLKESTNFNCASCGKNVSQKVSDYCLSRKDKFGGRVYCYECQRKR
jgi:restriction system protein